MSFAVRYASLFALSLSLSACAAPSETPTAAAAATVDTAPRAVAAAATTAGCPTASESLPLSLFWWKTQRDLQGFVWSSDGGQILGIQHLYEEKQYLDLLFGLKTETRKDCYQLYWTNLAGAAPQYIGSPSPLEVDEAFAFPRAGYIAVQKHAAGSTWQMERVGLDGSHRALASIDGTCDWARAVPSPDGAYIAFVHSVQTQCGSTTLDGSTTTVSFWDASGAVVGGSGAVTLAGYASATWTPAGQLIVTDGNVASAVALDGTVTPTSVPRCTDPATTSSDIDASGRQLGIADGAPWVFATDPTRAFGCQ